MINFDITYANGKYHVVAEKEGIHQTFNEASLALNWVNEFHQQPFNHSSKDTRQFIEDQLAQLRATDLLELVMNGLTIPNYLNDWVLDMIMIKQEMEEIIVLIDEKKEGFDYLNGG